VHEFHQSTVAVTTAEARSNNTAVASLTYVIAKIPLVV
jgi:hypothetical protein